MRLIGIALILKIETRAKRFCPTPVAQQGRLRTTLARIRVHIKMKTILLILLDAWKLSRKALYEMKVYVYFDLLNYSIKPLHIIE